MRKHMTTFALCFAISSPALAQQPSAPDSAAKRSMPDSARQPMAKIRIGSSTPRATLYVDGVERGP